MYFKLFNLNICKIWKLNGDKFTQIVRRKNKNNLLSFYSSYPLLTVNYIHIQISYMSKDCIFIRAIPVAFYNII